MTTEGRCPRHPKWATNRSVALCAGEPILAYCDACRRRVGVVGYHQPYAPPLIGSTKPWPSGRSQIPASVLDWDWLLRFWERHHTADTP